MNKDNGGPAFPVTPDLADRLGCITSSSDAGMTLRDYFAAKAMQGMLSDHTFNAPPQQASELSYRVADAMLRAREAE